MNNDLVNMLSIAFGSMIFYICYQILNWARINTIHRENIFQNTRHKLRVPNS
jgi:hypothetical protein